MKTQVSIITVPAVQMPAANTDQFVASSDGASSTDQARTKAYTRRTRVLRGPFSYRPGQQPPVNPPTRTLVIIIPSMDNTGTDEEAGLVRDLAKQIAQVPDVGVVTGVSVHEGSWELTLSVANPSALNDDQLLSETFRRLRPLLETSAVLQNGFAETKPTWKLMRSDFVADEGGFA